MKDEGLKQFDLNSSDPLGEENAKLKKQVAILDWLVKRQTKNAIQIAFFNMLGLSLLGCFYILKWPMGMAQVFVFLLMLQTIPTGDTVRAWFLKIRKRPVQSSDHRGNIDKPSGTQNDTL